MIWVFEDDPDHLELMRLYCAAAGVAEPLRVFRGDADMDALQPGMAEAPHLAIVDSNLIGIDGVAVITRLRELFPPAFPIIFYSSTPLESEHEAARRAGADRVVVKNFGRDGLPDAVRRLLPAAAPPAPPA